MPFVSNPLKRPSLLVAPTRGQQVQSPVPPPVPAPEPAPAPAPEPAPAPAPEPVFMMTEAYVEMLVTTQVQAAMAAALPPPHTADVMVGISNASLWPLLTAEEQAALLGHLVSVNVISIERSVEIQAALAKKPE